MRSTHSQTALTAWLVTAASAAAATLFPWRWSLDRSLVEQGEWWRLITGHFVHLSWQHYLYDLTALGVTLALCTAIGLRSATIAKTALLSAGTVSATLLLSHPVDIYGGVSGITAGLLSLGTLGIINKGAWFSGATLSVCLLLKILLELHGIAVSAIAPVWQAHAAGAATGIMIAASSLKQPTKPVSSGYGSTTGSIDSISTR
ncbi:rhombosortase [Trichlorobacter lovleyi]|uniref:rhombosortase n=1 Tax=Trichlorobacter lovleyi TaxID=313985 RepID=UPI00223FB037|nr:rhombosortase [Trichlorobacter lovleyi]QOX78242.1 rhombosortase [Trichlorobacter lovleyi]